MTELPSLDLLEPDFESEAGGRLVQGLRAVRRSKLLKDELGIEGGAIELRKRAQGPDQCFPVQLKYRHN